MLTPEAVISALRETDEYIKPIFLNGGCWRFYGFLKAIFPQAKPFKVAPYDRTEYVHIISEIDGKYYDITGVVDESIFLSCVPVEDEDISTLEHWGFSKNNLLFKRCPNCGEEILFSTDGAIVRQF